MIIKNKIIPEVPIYLNGGKASKISPHTNNFDYKSITIWSAIGFFLDDTTFYDDVKVLGPSCTFKNGEVRGPDWNWHYSPQKIDLDTAVSQFSQIFDKIIYNETQGKKVILPISGGLDSRTLAAACAGKEEIQAYGYSFENGLDESFYGEQISRALGFNFNAFTIKSGYLWNLIKEMVKINQCYTEFTHTRPLAVIDQVKKLGDIFLLGHWGDVLFDSSCKEMIPDLNRQVDFILTKIIKNSGVELAKLLWDLWGLEGNFESYLRNVVYELLQKIDISNTSARIRAFKSLHWAPRWANSNLGVFSQARGIIEPYYSDEICKYICSIPEELLANRKIQIEYIKRKSPQLARITWQDHRPFDLYRYNWNKTPWNLPFRLYDKIYRIIKKRNFIQSNWELQFLGEENDLHLQKYLFENKSLDNIISKDIINHIYKCFKSDTKKYSHSLSTILTLSVLNETK